VPCFLQTVESQCRSHLPTFRKERSTKIERFGAESNRLKIRLLKLLQGVKTETDGTIDQAYLESTDFRTHEQSVVSWISEKLVSQCPFCGKKFTPFRRKHHCRLCGYVLCDPCSKCLNLSSASSYLRVDSATSFNKELKDPAGQKCSSFRICSFCKHMLGMNFFLEYSHSELVSSVNSKFPARSIYLCFRA